ncbi:MAG: hypothetical protein ACKVQK_14395 [Burkholderiales bacterium]
MSAANLLAVVEVPREDRVRCQAVGCNHSVFRRIHVIRDPSGIHVYGSECFKKLFAGLPVASSSPKYSSSDGRQLTDEERQWLAANTERLIEQFESQYQEELKRQTRFASLNTKPTKTSQQERPLENPPSPVPAKPATLVSESARQAAEVQAKQIIRSTYGVNPELPGWRGLVLIEMERILRENVG